MKGVYVFLADGFEEIEALATVDILRRGGVDLRTVSITERGAINGAHGIQVLSDWTRQEFDREADFSATAPDDAMIFPGGLPGASNLASDEPLMEIMRSHYAEGGVVAAICAAPGLVVSQLPTLEGKRFTCYNGFEAAPVSKGGAYTGAPAEVDGNLITGRGPGCAVEFALAVLGKLKGEAVASEVRAGLLI